MELCVCSIILVMLLEILQVEVDNYERGVKWLQELLYRTQFTSERIQIIATKMLNEITR